jgi:hypothetical protein
MNTLSQRSFFGSVAAATSFAGSPVILATRAWADAGVFVPRKLPVPNDNLGAYEPTLSADGNTIYFARFANIGHKRVEGPFRYLRHPPHQEGWRMAGDGKGLVAARTSAGHGQQRQPRSGAVDHRRRQDALFHERP